MADKLTQEEEKELAELEALEAAELSAEEEAELAELEQLETVEQRGGGLILPAGSVRKAASEVAGAAEAFKDIMIEEDLSLSDFSRLQESSSSKINRALLEMEAELPEGITPEDVAEMAIPLGLGAKALGKGAKAAKAAAKSPMLKEIGEMLSKKWLKSGTPKKIGDSLKEMRSITNKYKPLEGSRATDSMEKIISAAELNPNRWHGQLSKAGIAASAGAMGAALNELANIESQVDLEASPVARTTDDLLRKRSQILNLIRKENPVIAEELDEAMDENDGDRIGAIMSMAAHLPGAKKYIEPGIGWDGKLHTPEEVQQLSGEIKSMRIPAWQKREWLDLVEKQGVIPQDAQAQFFEKEPARVIRDFNGKKINEF